MNIAIAGATGAVGQEMCAILAQRGFPAEHLTLLASERSAGKTVPYNGEELQVRELARTPLEGIDVLLFSAGSGTSRQFAGVARDAGAVLIDNSSAFRMQPGVPLVIPEVNPQDLRDHQGLIANPNCSTIIMALAVWPIHRVHPIRRIVVSTYQAASGAGAAAMRELLQQTRDVLDGKPARPEVLPQQSAFNLFSHNSAIDDSGYNEEERKMAQETRKMFHDDRIQVSATCVRVPVLRAHSESIHVECQNAISEREVRDLLEQAPGVRLLDDRARNLFPMPILASGQDDVLVGRIRRDPQDPESRRFSLLACGDQLRKGAALNAIQIMDLVLADSR